MIANMTGCRWEDFAGHFVGPTSAAPRGGVHGKAAGYELGLYGFPSNSDDCRTAIGPGRKSSLRVRNERLLSASDFEDDAANLSLGTPPRGTR